MTAKKARKKPIPQFKSREEEAKFWDSHDLSDYWGDFKPVGVRFAKKLSLSEGITIRLDPGTLSALRSEAEQRGVGPTTLARMWIIERLNGGDKQKSRRVPRRGA